MSQVDNNDQNARYFDSVGLTDSEQAKLGPGEVDGWAVFGLQKASRVLQYHILQVASVEGRLLWADVNDPAELGVVAIRAWLTSYRSLKGPATVKKIDECIDVIHDPDQTLYVTATQDRCAGCIKLDNTTLGGNTSTFPCVGPAIEVSDNPVEAQTLLSGHCFSCKVRGVTCSHCANSALGSEDALKVPNSLHKKLSDGLVKAEEALAEMMKDIPTHAGMRTGREVRSYLSLIKKTLSEADVTRRRSGA